MLDRAGQEVEPARVECTAYAGDAVLAIGREIELGD
jgi:hypothetical protein